MIEWSIQTKQSIPLTSSIDLAVTFVPWTLIIIVVHYLLSNEIEKEGEEEEMI